MAHNNTATSGNDYTITARDSSGALAIIAQVSHSDISEDN